jgi:phosphopantetheine adenylyltransferase
MKSIEVGQTIYVNIRNIFFPSKPNLTEYVVTKVNRKSFYARRKDSDYEYRFDKKTMKTEFLGEIHTAYLDPKEYWDKVELEKERSALCNEIKKHLNNLNIEKLREIKTIIDA